MAPNNSQQFQAQFSLNGQQVKDELKRIDDLIEKIGKDMESLYNDGTEGYKKQMRQWAEEKSALQQQKREMNSLNKVIQDCMKDLDKASPNQLRKTMRDINSAIDKGAIKRGTKDWQEAMRVLAKCDQELKKINAEIKAAGEGGGFFGKLFGGLGGGGAAGIVSKVSGVVGSIVTAFVGFKKVLGDIYTLNKDFEQQMANLASVLGVTKNEVKQLEQQALRLGETTMFTASQVAGLQVNLAKLGFSQTEIQNSTRAVLDFAAATGAALPEAASVAGAALKAFDLDATEMTRVASTMAVATTKSALDFEKLRTSISITFPVAKTFGITIEDTVALLGKLSDAGFEASSAATATRNILLNMANPAGKLAKALGAPIRSIEDLAPALQKLRDRGIDLAEAFALTDKRSVAAFTRFVQVSDQLVEMKESISDADEALRQMVETRMDTLQGSVTYLESAWQGLMLTFSESNGVLKNLVDWLTDATKALTRFFSTAGQNAARDAVQGAEDRMEEEKKLWKQEADALELDKKTKKEREKIAQEYLAKQTDLRIAIENAEKEIEKLGSKPMTGFNSNQRHNEALLANIENFKKAQKAYEDLLVEQNKVNYMLTRVNGVTDNSTRPPYNRDPFASMAQTVKARINEEQAEEIKLYGERKKNAEGSNAELEEIEQEHWTKMYQIAIAAYGELETLYRDTDIKKSNQYAALRTGQEKALAQKLQSIHDQFAKKRSQDEKDAEKALKNEIKNITQLKKLEDSMAKNQAEQMKANGVSELEADQWLNDELYKNRLKAIQARAALYSVDSDEYERAMQEIEQASEEHEQKVAETTAKARAKALQIVTQTENRANEWQKYQTMLDMLDKYHEAGILSEEEYSAAVDAVQKLRFKKSVEYAEKAADEINSLLSAAANYASAKYEAEIAQVEKRYDAEIEAAKKAGKDTTKIEKQKEKEVNALKLKEAEMQHDINIAQVLTDTALSIAKGYADYGPILGSVMAAVATAMGALQIATINQQFEAQKTALAGYYDGGFTGYSGNYRQVAGVTHEGEFVANHKTVNNPEIRPMLDMLDYAQKHNAEARLTQKDLAMAAAYRQGGYYGGGYAGGAPTVNVTPNVVIPQSEIYQRLLNVLDNVSQNGIDANVYVDDVNKAQKRKNQMLINKSRIA